MPLLGKRRSEFIEGVVVTETRNWDGDKKGLGTKGSRWPLEAKKPESGSRFSSAESEKTQLC